MKKPIKPYIMMDLKNNLIEVALSYQIHTEDKWFFAECPELQLVDQGRNQRESIENLLGMVKETLLEAVFTQNLETMLSELGFTKTSNLPDRMRFNTKLDSYEDMHPLKIDVKLPYIPEAAAI